MTSLEAGLLFGAGALYASSFLLAGKGWLRYGFVSVVAGLALHLASAAIRWVGTGHPPVFGTFEATLAASWFLMLFVALAFGSVHRQFRLLVLTAVPIALLLLAYGVTFFDTSRIPLTISERSLWVEFHALFSWLAFAPFTLAFCLSGSYLWSTRSRRAAAPPPAHADILDELAFRYITLGFVAHSVMFALGSYYSSILFGTWWRWDPAFSLSLVAWLLVGLYIHLRLFYHWNSKRAARSHLLIFAVIGFSYWGLIYLPAGRTFHVFDLDLKAL